MIHFIRIEEGLSINYLDKIWKFDGSQNELPTTQQIEASVSKIDFEKIELNRDSLSVFLQEEGMKIGFGAIGKGYAANKCMALMKSLGIKSGVVNAGGDLITWGKTKNDQEWSIGVADPNSKLSAFSQNDLRHPFCA